jgi:HD-like signal output (HDOD) protein
MQVLWVLVAWIVITATLAAFWIYYLSGVRDASDEPDPEEIDYDLHIPDAPLPESVAPESVDVEPVVDAQAVYEHGPEEDEDSLKHIEVSIHAEYPTIADIPEEMVGHLGSLTKALPKLPNVALDLLPVLAQPGSGAAEVAQVINRDQATAARMLRWVNSSFYGLEGKVTSLHRAITILGMDTVRSVVLEDSFSRGTFLRGLPGLAQNTIWRHAAAAGIAAKHLARIIRGVEPDVAATAGLLHDIGLLLILIVERQNLTKALAMSEEQNRPLIDTEFELLGFNHQIWGEAFVLAWRLPAEIGTAIGRHHTPLKEPIDRLAVTLWLADYLVSNVGFPCPNNTAPYTSDEEMEEIMQIVGLKPPLESHITQGLVREMINVTRFWSAGTPDEQKKLAAHRRR